MFFHLGASGLLTTKSFPIARRKYELMDFICGDYILLRDTRYRPINGNTNNLNNFATDIA